LSVVCTGSIAYDYILSFKGRFKDHILADKTHILNLSFSSTICASGAAVLPATTPTTSPSSAIPRLCSRLPAMTLPSIAIGWWAWASTARA
jgi:hypothetical protein